MKRSRRLVLAGSALLLFSTAVGSAAFLTLSPLQAAFSPEDSPWQNQLLPEVPELVRQGSGQLGVNLPQYGDIFTGITGAGYPAVAGEQRRSPRPGEEEQQSLAAALGISDGGQSGATGGRSPSAQRTAFGMPTLSNTLRDELEGSIEPPFGLGQGGTPPLAGLEPEGDNPMNPDPETPLPELPGDEQDNPIAVSEPQSWALLILGLGGLAALRRRKVATQAP